MQLQRMRSPTIFPLPVETQESLGCNSVQVQSPENQRNLSGAGEEEMKCPNSNREAGGKEWIPPSSTFCSMQALGGLDDAHHTGESPLLSCSHWFQCPSHLETPPRHTQRSRLVCTPCFQSRWHTQFAITLHHIVSVSLGELQKFVWNKLKRCTFPFISPILLQLKEGTMLSNALFKWYEENGSRKCTVFSKGAHFPSLSL